MSSDFRNSPSGGQGIPAFLRKSLGNVGSAVTVDWSRFAEQSCTLTANCVMTMTGLVPGKVQWFQMGIAQDATGGRTLSIVGARTAGGAGLTLSAGAGALDLVSFYWSGTFLYPVVGGLAFS